MRSLAIHPAWLAFGLGLVLGGIALLPIGLILGYQARD
jgi:hypothetical protein